MKFTTVLFRPSFFLMLFMLLSITAVSQSICNPSGNIMLYTNYDGGTLTINVNQNIPNLKIGICSYEACVVSLSGAFIGNVTEVRYAGYNGANNTSCGGSIPTTTILGAPGTATTSITYAPTATLANSFGYGSIICGYSCSNNTYQGGCNTVDQIEAYFLGIFSGSSLFAHKVQYGCWTGTHSVSVGGTCCPPIPVIPGGISASQTLCAGQTPSAFISTAVATGGSGTITYTWQASTTSSNSGFSNISSANSLTFSASALSTTTYYRRAASTASNNVSYSNVITITIFANPNLVITGPSGVCPGSSVLLTASGASTYTWLPGNFAVTQLTVPATSAGLYTIVATGINNCTASAVKQVTVNSLPVISVTGPTAVCTGSVAVLNASGASTYIWLPGNLSGSALSFTPTVNTSYTVIGTSVNSCTASAVFQLNVNPPPAIAAISSYPFGVCMGDIVSLTASGAVSYTWTPGNLVGNPVMVVPLIATSYTVYGAATNGCIGFVTIYQNVDPLPVFSLSVLTQPVCSGKATSLIASTPLSYTWQPGNLNGSTVTVTPNSSLVYTVVGSDPNCASTSTLSLTVIQSPSVVINTARAKICTGEKTLLTAGGAMSYTWVVGSGSSNSSSVIVAPVSNSSYSVTGSVGNGCDNLASITVSVSSCVAISDEAYQKNNGLELFPNPSNGEFYLRSQQVMELKIVNALGQVMDTLQLNEKNNYSVTVTSLSSGIYFVVQRESGTVLQKVIVSK